MKVTKYWYYIKFKSGEELKFFSFQGGLDLSKPLLRVDKLSSKWVDKVNSLTIITSEILYIEYGEVVNA